MTINCLFRGIGDPLKLCPRGFLHAVHSLVEKLHFAGVEGGIHVMFIDQKRRSKLQANLVQLQAPDQHDAHIERKTCIARERAVRM
jgi:hypothetical protein